MLDARWKIVLVAVLSVVLFFLDALMMLVFDAALLLLFTMKKLSWLKLWRLLRPMLIFFLFIIFAYAIQTEILEGMIVVLRFFSLVLLSSLMILSTTTGALVKGLERLLRPLLGKHARTLSLLVSCTLRFIPLIDERAKMTLQAQRARGAKRFSVKRLRVFIVRLLDSTFSRVDALSSSILSRGYFWEKE